MKKVSHDGHIKISIYARACVRILVCSSLALAMAGESMAAKKHSRRHYEELSRSKGQDAAPFLQDQDSETRQSAVLAIARDKAYTRTHQDLKDLAKNDPDISVRTLAIQAMALHQEGLDDIKTILEDESESIVAREAAAGSLMLFSEEEAVRSLGRVYVQSQDELKEHIKLCLEGLRNSHPELIESILGESDAK